jgi:hypothetical protein
LSHIRPLERDDLPAVGDLLRAELLARVRDAPRSIEDFLAETLFDGPWADPELPSWVATGPDGAVSGFLACHVRRMSLDGEPIRVVCCSHLAVAEGQRAGAAGAFLMRRSLGGPQDLTISDTAIDVVSRVWRLGGGYVDVARSCEWMHIFRPGLMGVRLARRGAGRQPVNRYDVPVPGLPLHLASKLIPRLRDLEEPGDLSSTTLGPAEAAELLPRLLRGVPLRPDYDVAYLEWLLARLRESDGELVHRLVRQGDRPVGWYVYLLRPSGAGRVLQVLADPRGADAVVAELFADARRRGATLLTGRVEPQLQEPLRRRLTAIGFGERHVAHSARPDVRAALTGDQALVTRLDGEWW